MLLGAAASLLLPDAPLERGAGAAAASTAAMPAGIDISRYQPRVEWLMLPFVPVHFVIIKASQGIDFVDGAGKSYPAKDRLFDFHWSTATASNELLVRHGIPPLVLGTYHVFQWNRDEVEQANAFLAVAQGALGDGFLPPALDVEGGPGNGWEPGFAADAGLRIGRWLRTVEAQTGKRSIVYTSNLFWSSTLRIGGVGERNPLWLASYDDDGLWPESPPPWSSPHFWQFSDRGKLAAVTDEFWQPVEVDLNRFNGSIRELLGMTRAR